MCLFCSFLKELHAYFDRSRKIFGTIVLAADLRMLELTRIGLLEEGFVSTDPIHARLMGNRRAGMEKHGEEGRAQQDARYAVLPLSPGLRHRPASPRFTRRTFPRTRAPRVRPRKFAREYRDRRDNSRNRQDSHLTDREKKEKDSSIFTRSRH